MTKKPLLFLVMSLPLWMVACKSVDTVQRAVPESTPDIVYDQRINTDDSLARKIVVLSVNQVGV